MYYSAYTKKLYLPKTVYNRVNAFTNYAFFFSRPEGYYVTFTEPDVELLQNSADHEQHNLVVGRSTLFVLFKHDYLPPQTTHITWHLMDRKKIIYRLKIFNRKKEELLFIHKELPPWLR